MSRGDLDQLHQEAVFVGDATRLSEIEAAVVEIQGLDRAAHAMLDSLQPLGS